MRLALALALDASDPLAQATFRSLSKLASVTGVQAAVELAKRGDAAALALLRGLVTHPKPAVRRSVARALGRELESPSDIRTLLRDADPSVRRAAAGALLDG